jgi:hypothetical protein
VVRRLRSGSDLRLSVDALLLYGSATLPGDVFFNGATLLAATTRGNETSEDFLTQELPVPLLTLRIELPIGGALSLTSVVTGGWLPSVNSLRSEGGVQGEESCEEATGRAKVIPQSPLSGLIARFSRLRQRIKPGVSRLPRLPAAVRAKALWICHFASTTSTLGGRCRCWFEKQPEGRSRKSAKGAGVG